MGAIDDKAANLKYAQLAATPGQPPSRKQIYRCRQNYGTNIGSCFVIERFMFHDIFPGGANNELEAVSQWTRELGPDRTREKFEQHWNNFMNEDDWRWLESHEVTSVRIPIGYWNVGGGRFVGGTRFQDYGRNYVNSWKIFREKFVEAAGRHSIGVVVDMHAIPYGGNGESHSGEKNGGKGEIWDNENAQLLMMELLAFIAEDLRGYDNISGIQVVNEADDNGRDRPEENFAKQARYYAAAINLIREKDGSVPVILSDAWWPPRLLNWIKNHQNDENSIGVVLDHHCYRCFLWDDKQKDPQKIINDLNNDLLQMPADGVDIMVGEYSCVLDEESWRRGDFMSKRDEYARAFGNRQIDLMLQRANVGYYFWSYKFQSGNGGEFDFRQMSDKGSVHPPPSIKGKKIPDQGKLNDRLNSAYKSHVEFWNRTSPNENFEHERYREGFITAWNDASRFAEFNGSIIGKRSWKTARFQEHIKARGKGNYAWEWQHGFDAGIQNFRGSF